MNFNKHFELAGRHAILSPSKYAWTGYDTDKLESTIRSSFATQRGTELHEFAKEAIRLGIKLPRSPKTLNMYVNDAIGYRMTPEQVLFFSLNMFGTADAISFHEDILRIHDLKTGVAPAKFRQLEVYAAMFCHEYNVKPGAIKIELRIYQNDEVFILEPDLVTIVEIMDKMREFDPIIDRVRMQELG